LQNGAARRRPSPSADIGWSRRRRRAKVTKINKKGVYP
jgi:hypothetical protein